MLLSFEADISKAHEHEAFAANRRIRPHGVMRFHARAERRGDLADRIGMHR